ncbi:HAD family hydrolase [Streptomonospora salina]|uniref:Phosphoglycolate phosphatase-like HAD superfamily hydrolase n=1 Tax=Streptomonospora salina TaxID=104205 RepID=A0A841E4J1_9ACTN|nr:haloacid dehalogenase-like hydrolase [Streptomonospora salina]MBB5997682.1 phosphoglycolate phosphatase-like HAD superfamily hydrolase [Streptomonospora salina]
MDRRLVLWDVDQTLVDFGGLGAEIFAAAFARCTGLGTHARTRGPGRTDWQAFRETRLANGLDPADEDMAGFAAAQEALLAERGPELLRLGRALPGVAEVLRRCAEHPGVVSSLLTGNTRPTAERKLAAVGLDGLVDTALGGYGDDRPDRAELVGIARERVERATGTAFTPETTVLVGDTPNDVRAALGGGARILAVATGTASPGDLRAAGAGTVLDDLSSPDAVLAELLR